MNKVFPIFVFLVILSSKYVYSEDFDYDYWLYIGPKVGGSIYFYKPSYEPLTEYFKNREDAIDNSGAFVGGLEFSIPLIYGLFIQTEILYTKDNPVFVHEDDVRYSEAHQMNMLTIPVLARWSYRLEVLRFGGYSGIYFNVPLGMNEVIFTKREGSSLKERNEHKINYKVHQVL